MEEEFEARAKVDGVEQPIARHRLRYRAVQLARAALARPPLDAKDIRAFELWRLSEGKPPHLDSTINRSW